MLALEFSGEAQPVRIAFWGCKDSSARLGALGEDNILKYLCSVISLFSDQIFFVLFWI